MPVTLQLNLIRLFLNIRVLCFELVSQRVSIKRLCVTVIAYYWRQILNTLNIRLFETFLYRFKSSRILYVFTIYNLVKTGTPLSINRVQMNWRMSSSLALFLISFLFIKFRLYSTIFRFFQKICLIFINLFTF